MLELNGVSYRYQQHRWLFKQINLIIHPGEVVGLYGKSGTGKTTMAKLIAGYKKPIEGQIVIDGKFYKGRGPHPVQLVWQHPEKVVNPRWRMNKTLAEAGEIDFNILNQLGIRQEWLNRYPSELSGGELQRFCVARALGTTTKYLIADEMTTMLDAINQAQIWHAVLQLTKKHQMGVLAISHDLHLLQQISDRIINFENLIKSC